jgi:leucyl-tRNA synthetase
VTSLEPFTRLEFLGFILAEDGRKMSKRWGNIINPSEIVAKNGADTLRVYEMFMGPFENTIAWSTDGLVGAQRFLERVHGLSAHLAKEQDDEVTYLLHKTTQKVSGDIEAFKFNTAVSALMIFINLAEKRGLTTDTYKRFMKLLAPFAPHIAEELWHEAGETESIHSSLWPVADTSVLEKAEVTVAISFNGKVRGTVTVPFNASEKEVLSALLLVPTLKAYKEKGEMKKVIFVQNKILNIIHQ